MQRFGAISELLAAAAVASSELAQLKKNKVKKGAKEPTVAIVPKDCAVVLNRFKVCLRDSSSEDAHFMAVGRRKRLI